MIAWFVYTASFPMRTPVGIMVVAERKGQKTRAESVLWLDYRMLFNTSSAEQSSDGKGCVGKCQ